MAALLRLAAARSAVPRRALAPHRRLAAAAAMEEWWSDWEQDGEEEARASAPAAGLDPAGGGPGGVQWVVMGRPGPQKHAHAARLAEVLAVPYISMGALLRQELNPASQLYRKVGSSCPPSGALGAARVSPTSSLCLRSSCSDSGILGGLARPSYDRAVLTDLCP
jgi:adenylate kinase